MKRSLTLVCIGLAVLAVASCDLFAPDAPELQVLVRPNPGDDPADLASESQVYFGKPGDGVNEDVVFTIRNSGTANLVLEGEAPNYVSIIDQNELITPFSIILGATTQSFGPGSEVKATIRFTGQSDSTRYDAKLLIPSNDPEHPGFFLNLVGDGDGFS